MEESVVFSKISAAPEDGSAYWIRTGDGVRLRVGAWRPAGNCSGTVFVLPGRSDYIEMYGHAVSAFVGFGYAALVIDWRGHGLSDRVARDPLVCHVNKFADYQLDVAAMVEVAQNLDLPKPWYLVGHSMGACIGLRALLNGLPMAACAFTAPMWDIHLSKVQRMVALPLTWAAQAVGKGHVYAPGYSGQSYVLRVDFEGNRLTSDPEMYRYWINQGRVEPQLHTGGPSMGWLYQSLIEMRSLSKEPSPNMRCLAVYGDQEEVVDVAAIQERIARWPGGQIGVIKTAKHEIMLESADIRATVISRICGHFASV